MPLAGGRARGGDVVVAPATPPGVSALAVVRLTGPSGETRAVARRLAPALPDPPTPRHAHLADFVDEDGRPLDRGLLLFFPEGASPTGEEVVEIYAHGSPGVVAGLLEAARRAGARPAAPGEFTRRALENGRVDLAEAEGLATLAKAESRGAVRRALGLAQGALSTRVHAARERALDALAAVEAALDFAEDVSAEEGARGAAAFRGVADELATLAASARPTGERRPVVAILGRPNAGKSTLFNALVGTDRAIVTATPGTTRDAISETVEIAGESVTLLDTAGLRQTNEEVERLGVEIAERAAARADLVLYVVDSQIGISEEEEDLLGKGGREEALLVLAKADLLEPAVSPHTFKENLSSNGARSGVVVSAHTGYGLDALRAALAARLGLVEAEGELLILARHKEALESAARLFGEAAAIAASGAGAELVAARAREGLDALGTITGETATEELLDRIFETFCVGK